MTDHEKRREDILIPFVEKVMESREKHNLSQTELADRAGLSKKYISLIENGWRLPPLETMIFLCAAAKMSRKEVEKMIKAVLDKVDWKN